MSSRPGRRINWEAVYKRPIAKKSWIQRLGPGLITGASKNDPSSITTYTKIGAQVGYGILWTLLLSYPFLAVIQEISARLGRVTGRGIAGNVRRHYPGWVLYSLVVLLVSANTFTLGADIGALADALKLMVGGPQLIYALLFAVGSLLLQIFVPYTRYVSVLKWLTATLLAYALTLLVVDVQWKQALKATILPPLSTAPEYLMAIIAAFGATINPYLFFWQASQEVEEVDTKPGEKPLKQDPTETPTERERIRFDTYLGMAYSNAIAFFIIMATAVTLHLHGKTDIETSAQAAEALRPLAGRFAALLFSLGIIGSGLLAVPVLAGSAAYAVGEALKWPIGLERKPYEAKGFYIILALATFIGLVMNFMHVDIIKALYWAAIFNGIASGPIMIIMMLMATNRKVMGPSTLTMRQKFLGWVATLFMCLAAISLFATWAK